MSTFTVTTAVNGSSLARLGSVAALAWSRVTTVATVTQNAHGMVTNDQINVTVTSDALAIVVGLKTITVVNASSYTFVCLNGGATTGTVTANHIDNFLINGGLLTIDTHTRFGLGSNTFAALGNITMSAALGGTIEFNSTLVRTIAYNTGAGTVPALDAIISQGGASGRLIGVYASLAVAPTAAGAVMPLTGFVQIRQWNSVAYAAGALTGIAASATGVDRAGWLDIVGVDAMTATVNRLNLFRIRGAFYEFQGVTTDGVRATGYQIPTNGDTAVACPGVEVETDVVGVYDFYPNAGTRAALIANIGIDSVRGRWCWVSTAGLVRFGSDGTNSTGGFVPPAGRRIRVSNLFFHCCTALAPTLNVLPNVTLTTRYKFSTTGGGVIDFDRSSLNWHLNFVQPFSVLLTNTNTFTAIILSECASPIAWNNVNIGQEAANSQFALTMSLNFAGGTMNRCSWTRSAQAAAGNYITSWSDCIGFTCTNERNHSLTKAANATAGTTTLTRVSLSYWTNTTLGGGRVLETTCTDVSFTSSIYYDAPTGTTAVAIPMFAFDISSNCLRCVFDGLTFGGLNLVQPYLGILSIGSAGCTDIKLRNLGTDTVPLDLGGPQVNATWSRATTTATATTPAAHDLKVGDIFYCLISSDITAITVGTKTVATVPTTTTFTFVCLNVGGTAGTIVYYPTMAALVVALAAGAAANTVRTQRVYTTRTRTGILTGDNSSKNIVLESVWGDSNNLLLVPELNCILRQVMCSPSLAAQTSVYGTHFADFYTTGAPANIAAVAWSRATTVATVTSNAHNLRTGDQINTTVTSDVLAIVRGIKTITATTANAFTFVCLNAGAAAGTLTFTPLTSRVSIQMNEATSETSSQVSLLNGSAFTSAGGLYMPIIGQRADFIAPTNVRGHSSFPISEVTMAGGTLSNYDITYSLDSGITFKNLNYNRAGGGGASASQIVTMTSTTGVAVGDFVFGTNIAPNAKVNSIDSATNVTVDAANIGIVSGILRFNQMPAEVVANSAVGFPLRIRIITITTNTTAINSLFFFTDSTNSARGNTYPLDVNTISFTGLPTGTDTVVLIAGTTTILSQVDSNPSSVFQFTYSGSQSVDVGFIRPGHVPYYIRGLGLTLSDISIPISLTEDRNYT